MTLRPSLRLLSRNRSLPLLPVRKITLIPDQNNGDIRICRGTQFLEPLLNVFERLPSGDVID
jgi:hypothetical protein